MVDKYINCTRKDCDGVMVRLGDDPRSKVVKYKCGKCGQSFSHRRSSVEAGVHTLQLNDPNDPLRGAVK